MFLRPLSRALFCWLIASGGCFIAQQYADWLAGAGLTEIKVQRPTANPGQILVTGRVPG